MSVVTAWLVNSLIMALVLTAGAAALELAARWSGRPARWGWLVALAGSVTLPWALRLAPGRLLPETMPVGVPMFTFDPLGAVAPGASQAGWTAPELAMLLWLGATLLAVTWVVRVFVQLERARRSWRETELEGARVYVTRDTGPAALGVRRGMIVVPSWALELESDLRSLLLLHEREHVRAGDPRLLLGGFLLVAVMPWNPLLWFQLLRLRNAIELDCDTRVLSSGASPERYGSLLLEVGRRRGSGVLVMATFAEPRMFLHDRIARIAKWPVERSPARAAGFTVLALLLFASALSARDPLRTGVTTSVGAVDGDAERLLMVSDTPPVPTYVPRTLEPELQNRTEVMRALSASYPEMMRDAGIGGTPTVWFYIDEAGAVRHTMISQGSGYQQLDEAALDVAGLMRFSPARNREQPVAVWVEIPIRFSVPTRAADEEIRAEVERREANVRRATANVRLSTLEARALEQGESRGQRPTSDPQYMARTVEPELQNRAEVAQQLVRMYPPMLRDAGIGGSPTVWVFIDETGRIGDVRLNQKTGHPELDAAAVAVASMMRFSPAMNREDPVAVWVEIPIRFSAR